MMKRIKGIEKDNEPTRMLQFTDEEIDLFDRIQLHLTTVSFGEILSSNKEFCVALRRSLPLMMIHIKENVRLGLSFEIKDARLIGTSVMTNLEEVLRKNDERRLCFEAAFIMLVASLPLSETNAFKSDAELLQRYPEFKELNRPDISTLLSFRNIMAVASTMYVPSHNKNCLLDIVTRIVEGKDKRYITGSGQTLATSNRVLIFERECGFKPVSKSKRYDCKNGDEPQITRHFPPKSQFAKIGIRKRGRPGAKAVACNQDNEGSSSSDSSDSPSRNPSAMEMGKYRRITRSLSQYVSKTREHDSLVKGTGRYLTLASNSISPPTSRKRKMSPCSDSSGSLTSHLIPWSSAQLIDELPSDEMLPLIISPDSGDQPLPLTGDDFESISSMIVLQTSREDDGSGSLGRTTLQNVFDDIGDSFDPGIFGLSECPMLAPGLFKESSGDTIDLTIESSGAKEYFDPFPSSF